MKTQKDNWLARLFGGKGQQTAASTATAPPVATGAPRSKEPDSAVPANGNSDGRVEGKSIQCSGGTGESAERVRVQFLEYSQAYSLLAFAISVSGPDDVFPAFLGVSFRSCAAGVVDLTPYEVMHPGTVICLVEHPEELGDLDPATTLQCTGEITFALWGDNTYRSELARIRWREWIYLKLGSLAPGGYRVDPCTAAHLEYYFEAMRQRYKRQPRWTAARIRRS